MRKAKKKNRIAILILMIIGLVSFVLLQMIINSSLANSNLELFPFFGLFVSFIFLVLNTGTFLSLKRLEKKMENIENTHESVSRLYFASTDPRDQTNILSVILAVDGEMPLDGLGDYGKFVYLFGKNVKENSESSQATEIIVASSFYSARYGLEGFYATIDYIFTLPKLNYLLVFDERQRKFGVFPNWLGESMEEIMKDLKYISIMAEEEANSFLL